MGHRGARSVAANCPLPTKQQIFFVTALVPQVKQQLDLVVEVAVLVKHTLSQMVLLQFITLVEAEVEKVTLVA